MRSLLQPIALVSAILLIASCDSGGTSGVTATPVTPPAPQTGLNGRAVKGIIAGGAITVVDSAGADVPLASGGTSGADGSYSLLFTSEATAAGISAPLVVTVSGGPGATMVCDIDIAGTDDDCAVGDGTSVAFGESYPLPTTFAMRGIVSEIPAADTQTSPTVTVNLNPATDLAASLALDAAAGTALTASDVAAADSQVLGLIQTITGTDLTGQTLSQITIPNVADSADAAAASPQSLALAAFGAAIIANQGAGETVGDVIARVNASLSADEDGNLAATGTELASLTSSVVTALTTVSAQVTAGGGDSSAVDAAVDNAETIEEIYDAIGDEDVGVPPLPDPDSDNPVDETKAFIANFSNVVSSALASTGAAGAGVDGQSATELFAAELDAASKLNSGLATAASRALQDAVNATASDLVEDGTIAVDNADATNPVTFSLTKAGTVFTVADASSTQTGADGTTLVITATTGTSNGDDVFSLEGVSMVTTQPGATAEDAAVTIQTFTAGTLNGAVVDGNTVTTFDGTVTGASPTTSFGISATYTDPVGVLDGDTFTATISFASATADDLSLTLSGTPGQDINDYSVTAGGNTVAFTLSPTAPGTGTAVFSDGVVLMTLSLLDGVVVTDQTGNIAALTVAGVETGTISANGTVTYSDGSVQSLPAGIF